VEGHDAAAIEASAKMVHANNKYYKAIFHTIDDLNGQLRALIPPDPKLEKYNAANTDSILLAVATAMETVQKNYTSYRTEVIDAAKNVPIKYTVKSGDNLSDIAAAEGTTWQKVYASNRSTVGSDPNLIQPGQVLTIKRGKDAKSAGSSTPSSKTSTGKTTGGTTTKAAPKTTTGGRGHITNGTDTAPDPTKKTAAPKKKTAAPKTPTTSGGGGHMRVEAN
jgi:LysM repeat protein